MIKLLYFLVLPISFMVVLTGASANIKMSKKNQLVVKKTTTAKKETRKSFKQNLSADSEAKLAKSKTISSKKNNYSSDVKKRKNQKTKRKLSTDVDESAKAAKKEVQKRLDAISNLCHIRSLTTQINQLEQSLSILRKVISEQLNNTDLDISYGIFFREVYHAVAEPGLFITSTQKLTVKVIKKQQINLAESFLHSYQVQYNLDAISDLDQFRHEWAKKVYQGLQCIKLPHGKTI